MDDLISRQAALDALGERPTVWTDDDDYALGERNQYDMDRLAIETVPSAQLVNIAKLQPNCNQVASDCISRAAAINAICEDGTRIERQGWYSMTMVERKQRDVDILENLPSAQPGWTYIEEALPKTIINKHTHDFQEYNCLCDFDEYGFDVRTYKFGDGHFWNGGGAVDKYVTAWQPLPEVPDALKQKQWEGEQ